MGDERLIDAVRERALPLESDADLDPLLELVGDARIVWPAPRKLIQVEWESKLPHTAKRTR